jgi:hypothetical protein
MTKLASIEDLRNMLARDEEPGMNGMVSNALETVTPMFEGILLTRFDRVTDQLAMYCLADAELTKHGMAILYLPRTLLLSEGLEVRVGPTLPDAQGATALEHGTLIIDYGRGYITLPAEVASDPMNQWVVVTYSAGLEEGEDDIGKTYNAVPPWLHSAALQAAAEVFEITRDTVDADKARRDVKLPTSSLNAIAQYRRTKQPVVLPL